MLVCFVFMQLFAIIVFSCIASQGYDEKGECQFNNDNGACNFGTTVGVIAFLGLIALLISDALFENLSSIKQRKYIVMGDMGFSGTFVFLLWLFSVTLDLFIFKFRALCNNLM